MMAEIREKPGLRRRRRTPLTCSNLAIARGRDRDNKDGRNEIASRKGGSYMEGVKLPTDCHPSTRSKAKTELLVVGDARRLGFYTIFVGCR
uniref:Uncharacterized protein n=1 Tax=Panagrellus redivivus TaxID=6233 RepID=A0A7E4W448_PANRE